MKPLILFSTMLFLSNCGPAISMNTKSINFEWKKDEEFKLAKLKVAELNKDGYPMLYEIDSLFLCEPKNGLNFKPKSKIWLDRENRDYSWYLIEGNNSKKVIKQNLALDKASWYKLFPLIEYMDLRSKNGECCLFVYVNNKSKIKEFLECDL